MKKLTTAILLSAFLLTFTGGAMFWGGPQKITAPKLVSEIAGAEAMKLYDTNGDGVLSGDELDATPALKACETYLNRSGKGITAKDIADRVQQWLDSKIGLTLIAINIKYDGKPVAGGTVTLTPEAFMGPNFSQATGKIFNGTVTPSCANNPDGLTGLPIGFYTVTFSELPDGVTAPEKMGIEIFDRNPEFMRSNTYTLELKVE